MAASPRSSAAAKTSATARFAPAMKQTQPAERFPSAGHAHIPPRSISVGIRPTSAPGAYPKGHRVSDIPLRRRGRSLPGRPAAVTSGSFSRSRRRACSRDCVRNFASASCTSRSSRRPSTSDVGDPSRAKTSATWPPAKRDRGAVRRSASSIVTGTTITPSPPRAPLAGSLHRPAEATVTSKRARCARCSPRASTTKLSRRSCRQRARQRAAAPPRRSLRGRPGRRVELLVAIAPRGLVEAIVWGRPRGSGAWDGCVRACSVSAERASRSISSRHEPTSPPVRELL
jgi:hypothetical protein